MRNNGLSGTHLITLGNSAISYANLVELYLRSVQYAETAIQEGRPPIRATKARGLFKVDKQDDGAARRFFHAATLLLTTEVPNPDYPSEYGIVEGFEGLFAINFVFG